MFLKSAHIRHYKSLDDVQVEFSDPITVVVGPNAAGKSNFVDCLRFVRDATATDLEHAVGTRGGIGRVRQFSRTRPFNVGVSLEFSQNVEGTPEHASYEFALQSLTGGNYSIEYEKARCRQMLWFSDDEEENSLRQRWSTAGFDRNKSGKITTAGESLDLPPLRPDQLALGFNRLFDVLGEPISDFVKDWRYSAIYPNTLRHLSSPDKDTSLAEDGTNWASVIKALKRSSRGRAALERIFEAMRTVVPTFEEVAVKTVGSYLVPQFRFSSNGQLTEFDPAQLSDGTLRVFGILLALYQVPAPTLLVLEEPEQTVHPGVLSVLADALREASETTQIIVTTHSPHFVDQFSPEEIRVATLSNGWTKISPIKATQVEAVKNQLISLEEFMLAEGLQPADS